VRKRTLKIDSRTTGDRMIEGETVSVQELTIKSPSVRAAPIHGVPDDRKTGRFQMDTDLVGPSGLQTRLTQGNSGPLFEHANVRHRLTSGALTDDRHAQSVPTMTGDRTIDAKRRRRSAVDQDKIPTLDASLAQHALKAPVDLLRARDHHEPTRVAIEPVDDPWTSRVVTSRRGHCQQAVHERPRSVPPRRMDNQARRLVDDDQILILVGEPEGDARIRLEFAAQRRSGLHANRCTGDEGITLARRLPIDLDPPITDQALSFRAASDLRDSPEHRINPLPHRVRANHDHELWRIGAQRRRQVRRIRSRAPHHRIRRITSWSPHRLRFLASGLRRSTQPRR
jgi:hypothetical protein